MWFHPLALSTCGNASFKKKKSRMSHMWCFFLHPIVFRQSLARSRWWFPKILLCSPPALGKNHPIGRSHILFKWVGEKTTNSLEPREARCCWWYPGIGSTASGVGGSFLVRKMLVTGDEPPLLESFPNGDKVEWKIYILKDNFSGQIIATSHDLGPQIVVE